MIEVLSHPASDADSTLRIVELRLARPDARNALDGAMLAELTAQAERVAADPSAGALVLSAEGPVFCAGGDLHEIAALARGPAPKAGARQVQQQGRAALTALSTLPVPVLCALDGPAYGGGAELALAADLRFAGPKASLTLKHVAVGLCPSWGTTARLPHLLGYAKACELLLLARPLSAEAMSALGLAVLAPEGARVAALTAAAKLCGPSARSNLGLLRKAYSDPSSGSPTVAEGQRRGALDDAEREVFEALFGEPEHLRRLAAFTGEPTAAPATTARHSTKLP